jgi:hypothetical protein
MWLDDLVRKSEKKAVPKESEMRDKPGSRINDLI